MESSKLCVYWECGPLSRWQFFLTCWESVISLSDDCADVEGEVSSQLMCCCSVLCCVSRLHVQTVGAQIHEISYN